MFIILILIPLILYIGFETLKQRIYFHPSTECDFYSTNIPDLWIDSLHAWYMKHEQAKKTIIYFHGNAGNIGHRTDTVRRWNDQGFSVLMYDYPSYGLSKGYATEKSLYQSGETIMEYVLQETTIDNIILYGESIGCSVASHVASKYDVPCIVLQSGFCSIQDLAKNFIPVWLDWLLPLFCEFNTYEMLQMYQGKIMILHSRQDDIIPFDQAEKLNNANINSSIYEIQGTHNYPVFDLKPVVTFMNK